jgi:hypothetical protein
LVGHGRRGQVWRGKVRRGVIETQENGSVVIKERAQQY